MADSANWTDLSQLKSMPLLYPEDSPAYKAGTVLTEGLTEIVAPEEQTRRLALNDEEVRTADEFSEKIELEREEAPPRYAQGAQQHMADYSLSELTRFRASKWACLNPSARFDRRTPHVFGGKRKRKWKGLFKRNFANAKNVETIRNRTYESHKLCEN
jgi:hypothetical protein